MIELNLLGPGDIVFEPVNHGRLTCRLADGTRIEDAHCVVLFPFSDPGRYISVITRDQGDVREWGILDTLDAFPAAQARIIQAAVDHRYFFPEILDVYQITESYGLHEWEVRTDRGLKLFFVHDLKESVIMESSGAIVVTDIETCRYKIRDPQSLPPASRAQIERILP